MTISRHWTRRPRASWILLAGLAWPVTADAGEPPIPRTTRTPLERLSRTRLRTTHDDVVRIQSTRRALPPLAGLLDVRAVLHAHAEDSSHTGGTRPEMLEEARRAGVDVILLSDHYRPPRDFIRESWRGVRDGVLFVPGSEVRGFLIYPARSIMDRMEAPAPAFIAAVREGGGLIFLSHIEERPDHPMDGLDGLEIYNRHYDATTDLAGLIALAMRITDPDSLHELADLLRLYPDELFAFESTYPLEYMRKWDRETPKRRLTGVAANDCHHNMVLVAKMVDESTVRLGTNVDRDEQMRVVTARLRPGVRALTEGHNPGDVVARIDLDPYHRSFRNVSTHVLVARLDEPSVREALRSGHAYVSHDWMCDPTGFRFGATADAAPTSRVGMGDECPLGAGVLLRAEFPVPCRARVMSNGKPVAAVSGDRLDYRVTAPGVYRLEAWLELGGEERPWIYSNPIYVR